MRCDAPIFFNLFSVYTDLRFFSIRTFANIIVIILYNWPFPCTCTCIRAVANRGTVRKYTHEYLMSHPEWVARDPSPPPPPPPPP